MRARLVPALLGVALLLPLVGCGDSGRFVGGHQSSIGPVTGPAVALAKKYRLGPDGFGQVNLGASRYTGETCRAVGRCSLSWVEALR